ncbi:MAG TPA: DHHA1 domain-containing protein, partial [Bdellovibrionota bacterium]|nr:DHHA1 domain-containing protein [Bdellovibrionota bacterium]
NWDITPEIATSLFCGIVADTGSFKYRNTTAKVLRMAAQLVDSGAHPENISQRLFDIYPASRILLLKRVLQSLRFDCQNRVASVVVTENDLAATGASIDASEGFVEILRGIEGVQVSVLAKEQKDGNVKISTRSKDNIDVAAVTKLFGGGGHRVAAGATLPGPVNEALGKFIKEVSKHLK